MIPSLFIASLFFEFRDYFHHHSPLHRSNCLRAIPVPQGLRTVRIITRISAKISPPRSRGPGLENKTQKENN